jgi:predicted anti-sigma-YlaC factor YlaD
MRCDDVLDHLSALLDGELEPEREQALHAHLAECGACRGLEARLQALHRAVRLHPAEPVPDLTDAVLARVHPPRPGRRQWVRFALASLALTEIVLGLPALVFGNDPGASVHVARHVGSLTVAMAIGLLYAAWRPVRAFGLVPVVASLAALSLVTALADTIEGQVSALAEAHHVLEVLGLVLLWQLAGRPRPMWRGRRGTAPGLVGV